MKIKICFIALLTLLLSGCATLQKWHQEWLNENCNPEAAYTNGLTDGLRPGQMPNNYARQCPYNQAAISRAYLKGFSKGLKARPQEININKHDKKENK